MSKKHKNQETDEEIEKPDSFWLRIYGLVVIVTILTIASLGFFSFYFSR